MKPIVVATVCVVALVSACSGKSEPEPLPDHDPVLSQPEAVAEQSDDTMPMEGDDAEPAPPTQELPSRSPEAIAWVESRDGAVMGATGVAADGVPYVVHCASEGVEEIHFVLLLDGEEHSDGTWRCDGELINAAFDGAGQEVEVQFVELSNGSEGYAEVLPWSDELDPPGQ